MRRDAGCGSPDLFGQNRSGLPCPEPVMATPFHGILRTWHEDRGFGFIAPTDGGREVFVHFSAFPNDGSRPVVGERLTFELAPGRDGKAQAVRVTRLMVGRTAAPVQAGSASQQTASEPRRVAPAERAVERRHVRPPRRGRSIRGGLAVLVVVGLVACGYSLFRSVSRQAAPLPPAERLGAPVSVPFTTSAPTYRCDGRLHCSQMTSCEEATFFLRNCPGVQMDGNGDGVPCEQQWCR